MALMQLLTLFVRLPLGGGHIWTLDRFYKDQGLALPLDPSANWAFFWYRGDKILAAFEQAAAAGIVPGPAIQEERPTPEAASHDANGRPAGAVDPLHLLMG